MSNDTRPRSANEAFLDDLIAQSCATKGGHLWINPSEWTLYPGLCMKVSEHSVVH